MKEEGYVRNPKEPGRSCVLEVAVTIEKKEYKFAIGLEEHGIGHERALSQIAAQKQILCDA